MILLKIRIVQKRSGFFFINGMVFSDHRVVQKEFSGEKFSS